MSTEAVSMAEEIVPYLSLGRLTWHKGETRLSGTFLRA
jgi:hypothetical protein